MKYIVFINSLSKIIPRLKVGDKSLFAKNGGESVLKINLFSIKKLELLRDKRKAEKIIEIETVSKKND